MDCMSVFVDITVEMVCSVTLVCFFVLLMLGFIKLIPFPYTERIVFLYSCRHNIFSPFTDYYGYNFCYGFAFSYTKRTMFMEAGYHIWNYLLLSRTRSYQFSLACSSSCRRLQVCPSQFLFFVDD